ncbi:type II secretion system F family protein, partial [Caulobacter sp. 17J65-9]|uniref:type II secretion system F family protein n=1 Tax=Caulobacter sp. 17J65-9 TaxID=2709382 RepID=UPI0013C988EF
ALRRGDRIAAAVAEGLPGYPPHVYALIRAGEASGQLPRVLGEAARQVEAEARARREFADALTYPAFLTCAGLLVVGFLFYAVVPRFAQMLGPVRDQVDGLQNLVLSLGEGFHQHAVLVLATIAAACAVTAAVLSDAGVRRAGIEALARVPGLGRIVIQRQRAGWARIMAFSLGAGVGLLEAAELAAASLPDGRFRRSLAEAAVAFRAGKSPAEAFAAAGALSATDVSLLRAGQRSGVLAEMFQVVADTYEEDLRTTLKRAAVVAEQAAIACVASAIGAVVLSLVTALTALYDSIG